MTIKPIVEWLQVKKQGEQEQTVMKEMTESFVDHLTVGIADIIQSRGRHWWMNKIANLTDEYLTPILVREPDKIKNQSKRMQFLIQLINLRTRYHRRLGPTQC